MNMNRLYFVVLVLFASIDCEAQGTNAPPVLSAIGANTYCAGTNNYIVSNITITDPDDTTIDAMYIQISTGFQTGDLLTLTGTHPTIITTWDASSAKLTLRSPTNVPVTYVDFKAAIEDVIFTSGATNPTGSRAFSITVGQANYLPSTGHYYQFVPWTGIHWTAAKVVAENTTYYGLQGYLATILSQDEAQLCGEQSNGTGWIGGSDSEQEGTWKWMTGPEAGTVFWVGVVNGTTPNFAFWNNGEPNNLDEEDYAHITAPGVGVFGSWNDLGDEGGPNEYEPKGYIIEFGGMSGDPVLNISASTTLFIPSITSSSGNAICGPGQVTLNAVAANGTVYWYANTTGGNPIATGNSVTTPPINQTTTYYVSAFDATCPTGTRIPVIATINDIPTILSAPGVSGCEGSVTLTATASSGTIRWYDDVNATTPIFTGDSFTTPSLSNSTTYYAESIGTNNCPGARVAVNVTIYPLPVVSGTIEVGFCENASVILNAAQPNVSYLWSTGETTSQITVSSPGFYDVTLTTPENCSATQTFLALQSTVPVIVATVVSGNTLTIISGNSGNFEYSIDGVNFQDSPVFVINGAPITEVFASEVNGCGDFIFPFMQSIVIPAFFTPNADGFHDFWTVNGMVFYPNSQVFVYDRYGKLLKSLNKESMFWDGFYNGNPLPADDYWFTLDIDATQPQFRGHFSLKR